MYKKIVLRSVMLLMVVGLVFGISSCRGDDNSPQPGVPSGKNYKVTLTLDGFDTNDYVSFSLAGSNSKADTNLWKMKGVTQAGQLGIGLQNDNFTGSTKTYVLESNFNLISVAAGLSVTNFGTNTITGVLKIERDGSVVVNESINLMTDGANIIKHYNL